MSADTASAPALSVVLASPPGAMGLEAAIEALRRGCEGIDVELLVVGPNAAPVASVPWVRPVLAPAGALVPELWAAGAAAATGRHLAFTIPEVRVPAGWARALLGGLGGGAVGAGGGLVPAPGSGLLTRAVWALRYSGHLPPRAAEPRHEIAGDNAAYDGAAFRRHHAALAHGFWEVEVHRILRADGGTLVAVPDATVVVAGPFRFRDIWSQRLRHGRHFGAWRVRATGAHRWLVAVLAPAVPLVLLLRIVRRLASRPELLRLAVPALPLVLVLAGAWAAGEAIGAWRGGIERAQVTP